MLVVVTIKALDAPFCAVDCQAGPRGQIRPPDNFFYKLNQLTLSVKIFGLGYLYKYMDITICPTCRIQICLNILRYL